MNSPPCDTSCQVTHDNTILLCDPPSPTHFPSYMPAQRFLYSVGWSRWLELCGRAVFLNSVSLLSNLSTCVSREIVASLRGCGLTSRSLFANVTGSEFGFRSVQEAENENRFYSLFHLYSQSVNRKAPLVSVLVGTVFIFWYWKSFVKDNSWPLPTLF